MNPTPQSSLGDREGVESRRQTETARVVVVDDNQLRASTLAAALKGASDTIVVVTGPDSRAMHHDLFPADLVLLALGGRQVSALATGAEAVQRNPYAEVIFYCDDPDAPEVSAAAVLGITRIVPAQSMAAWLARAGGLLARGAYLRRVAAATIAVAPAAADAGSLRPRRCPLAAANGRDAVSRKLHPLPADPERKPARGGSPGRRPLPDHVRDDPQAGHLDDVIQPPPAPDRSGGRRPGRSTLASLCQLVGNRLVAPLLLASAEGFTAGDRFFDHLPPLTGPQVGRPRCRLGALRRRDDLDPMAVERLDRRARGQAEPLGEPPGRLRCGRARRGRRSLRRSSGDLGRARLDRSRTSGAPSRPRRDGRRPSPRPAPAQPGAPP